MGLNGAKAKIQVHSERTPAIAILAGHMPNCQPLCGRRRRSKKVQGGKQKVKLRGVWLKYDNDAA